MRYADWPAVERAGIYVRPAGSKKLVGALAETAAGLFQPINKLGNSNDAWLNGT